tara:strand:- start:2460 stop:2654 length:195 start_codon:yes stop_codon:yes gene_type:complete
VEIRVWLNHDENPLFERSEFGFSIKINPNFKNLSTALISFHSFFIKEESMSPPGLRAEIKISRK